MLTRRREDDTESSSRLHLSKNHFEDFLVSGCHQIKAKRKFGKKREKKTKKANETCRSKSEKFCLFVSFVWLGVFM
jgi:hypothetical protein